MLRNAFLIACILCFLPERQVHGIISIPTDTLQWTLTNSNKSISVAGNVPGGVYTDLMNSGVLNNGDFYYRYNDLEYRWVSYDNWTYRTTLDLDESLLDLERVVFSFDGIDTAAEIYLNDSLIATTNNMFSSLQVDVKEYLIQLPNTVELSILLLSPVQYSEAMFDSYLDVNGYEVLPDCVDSAYKGECHANTIRKMQSSFGWDVGPAFPNLGIWKPWRIEGWSSLKITNLYIETVPNSPLPNKPEFGVSPSWTIYYKIYFELTSNTAEITGTLVLTIYTTTSSTEIVISPGDFPDLIGYFEGSLIVAENTVVMWWPNGYGQSAPVYSFDATFTPRGQPDSEESSKSVAVGFRTAEFDESFVDESDPDKGRYFRAKINNVYMFLKGSIWIPAHILPEQVTEDYIYALLYHAHDANINCLRVWGGGIYETDYFYKFADTLGILIWQDLMFANNMYPADEAFLNNTAAETRYQVRRIQHHPSILLWSTNFENEAALNGDWYGTESNFEQYETDYVKLYVDTLATVLKEEDPSRKVIISSPSNGIASEEAGYIADNPNDNHYGDNHYFNYTSNAWKYESYPDTRFASAYGLQSFSSYKTLENIFDEEDMEIDSPMMEHRQHHPNGQNELDDQLKQHFKYDSSTATFREYLYLLQIHQAMAVRTASEYYRRMMQTLNEDGSGLTMGAMYWHLNEIWPGASWSSLEYGGRWKILHNYVRHAFASVIAVPWIENGKLMVTVVSDYMYDRHPTTVTIEIARIAGKLPPVTYKFDVEETITTQSAVLILSVDLEDDLHVTDNCPPSEVTNEPYDNCFVTVNVAESNKNYELFPENFLLLGEPKNAILPQVNFNVTLEFDDFFENQIIVTVMPDDIALFIFLETSYSGFFDDNGFVNTKPYGTEKRINFIGDQGHYNLTDFALELKVTSLVG